MFFLSKSQSMSLRYLINRGTELGGEELLEAKTSFFSGIKVGHRN